jgi:hypothetical protein
MLGPRPLAGLRMVSFGSQRGEVVVWFSDTCKRGRSIVKRRVGLWAIVVLIASGARTPGFAQVPSDKWEVTVAPYFRGAAMSGTTAVRDREVDVDVSASDIFSNLQFGATGLVVARKATGNSAGTPSGWRSAPRCATRTLTSTRERAPSTGCAGWAPPPTSRSGCA